MVGLMEAVPTTTTTTACPDWVDVAGVIRTEKKGFDMGLQLNVGETSILSDGPRDLTVSRISAAQLINGSVTVTGALPWLTISVTEATLEGLGGDVVVLLTSFNGVAPKIPAGYKCAEPPVPIAPALAIQLYRMDSGSVVPATDFAVQLNVSLDYNPIPTEDGVQAECAWFNRDDGTWWGGVEPAHVLDSDGNFQYLPCPTSIFGQGTSYTPEGPGKRLQQSLQDAPAPQIMTILRGRNISDLLTTTTIPITPAPLPPEELPMMSLLIIGAAILVGIGLPLFLVLITPICMQAHKKRLKRMNVTSSELARTATQAALQDNPSSSSQV